MFKFSRLLIAYACAVPLALILGYLVVWPSAFTFGFIGVVLFILATPLIIKWHHFWLIVLWNSPFLAFFLPGQLDIWLPLGVLSFTVSFLNHIMFQKKFLHAPELTRPLIFMLAILLFTAWVRGGVGVRALGGGTFGGKYYYYVIGAILGYFAFTAEAIPLVKARRMAGCFFLSGATAVSSNIVYWMGPAFYFLYLFIPAGPAMSQYAADMGSQGAERISSLSTACVAVLCFLLGAYGIRGLFDLVKPWRFGFLCVTVGAAFFSGFRSSLLIMALIFAFQFYLERLVHTHYLPIAVGVAICCLAPVLFFSSSMPLTVQRAISFLPVNVNSDVLAEAKGSTEWRLNMWAEVWKKEVPKYLLIGKGYAIDPYEIETITTAQRLGLGYSDYEGSMVAEDYHSGPLSVLVPFGIPGVVGFIWILIGGYRVLLKNLRFGDAGLRKINTVLLAYYLTNCISFFFIFGALSTEIYVFMGICGMSVSLNGGVRKKAVVKRKPVVAAQTFALQPG